eukprot:gnl/MRDRNA2_/MRDRNA2_44694_c0_seq1.p1 gnl/MRDRNA2_/MRDRNA2_44694_c0~~gnl/MRDRNA2_/MRDRNA2_44694_c0_seq1.p1  ORF type:complete len:158 (+),score=16.95 gnl/MRDRNA2_/MRDRNA2_44694_c0_seq1:66-539(+)
MGERARVSVMESHFPVDPPTFPGRQINPMSRPKFMGATRASCLNPVDIPKTCGLRRVVDENRNDFKWRTECFSDALKLGFRLAPESSQGSHVRLSGLTHRPELNGTKAQIVAPPDKTGRYAVWIADGETGPARRLRVSAVRLEPLDLRRTVSEGTFR